MSQEEWDNLPEPGEHRIHSAKEKRNERYTAAPDTLLMKARQEAEVHSSIDQKQMDYGGMETPMQSSGTSKR